MVLPLFVSENVRLYGWVLFFIKGGVLLGTLKSLFGLELESVLFHPGTIIFAAKAVLQDGKRVPSVNPADESHPIFRGSLDPDVNFIGFNLKPADLVAGDGWFLNFHCFAKYIKVAFFRGSSLRPMPPGASKSRDTRYLDIREGDPLDEARFAAWVTQASQLPGERM